MGTWKRIITEADDTNYKNSNVKSSDLPEATTSALGGIKVGSNLSILADGTLSASGGSNTTNSSLAFDTSTGVLTLTDSAGGTVTKDLDGRYPTDKVTNLSISGTTGALTIASSTGTNAVIPIQSGNNSGLMDKQDRTDIDANSAKTGITTGQANAITANSLKTGITNAQASAITANTAKATNVTTNLTYTASASAGKVNSSDGTNATIPVVDGTNAGLMTPTQKGELATALAKVSCDESNVKSVLSGLDSSDTLHIGDTGNDATIAIRGNLTVSGTTTTVNSTTVNIADNIITLNSDVTGTPTENGGIQVERGNQPNPALTWAENADAWMLDYDGSKANIATVDISSSSAPSTQDGLGVGSFWLRTGANEIYVRTS